MSLKNKKIFMGNGRRVARRLGGGGMFLFSSRSSVSSVFHYIIIMVHDNNSIIKHDIILPSRNVLYDECMVILDGREYMAGWMN